MFVTTDLVAHLDYKGQRLEKASLLSDFWFSGISDAARTTVAGNFIKVDGSLGRWSEDGLFANVVKK